MPERKRHKRPALRPVSADLPSQATYPRSQHKNDETLLDFCLRRLECFKHFFDILV